ncbi:HPr family phosphocarrier protein [Nocardia sp. NPDC127526]|uniref:HPr family phosphocarrier protein n=1 Tax=Nocardia sp. NPDC127526 TaxID=3345393 RepID=UPI00363E07A1
MPSTTVIVGSAVGLHARPAAVVAQTVLAAGVPVTIALPDGAPVDAGSALMIMSLGAAKGAEVIVSSEDQATLDKIAGLIASDLDA